MVLLFSVSSFSTSLSIAIPCCQSMLGKCDWQVCVAANVFALCTYKSDSLRCADGGFYMWQVSVSRSAHLRVRHCSLLPANSVKATGTPNKKQQRLDVWPSGMWGSFVGGVQRRAYVRTHIHIFSKHAFPFASTLWRIHTQKKTHTRRVTHSHRHKRGAEMLEHS